MYCWLSGIWETAFLRKNTSQQHGIFWIVFNPSSPFFLVIIWLVDLTLMCHFAQDLIINSIVYSILLFPGFLWYALLSTVVLSAYFSVTP